MNKAEQKSIEWQKANHPMAIGGGNFADVVDAYNVNPAFVAGYKEAEKDLALTWEDMNLIDSILIDLQDEGVEKYGGLRQYYEEALKRFNEKRKK